MDESAGHIGSTLQKPYRRLAANRQGIPARTYCQLFGRLELGVRKFPLYSLCWAGGIRDCSGVGVPFCGFALTKQPMYEKALSQLDLLDNFVRLGHLNSFATVYLQHLSNQVFQPLIRELLVQRYRILLDDSEHLHRRSILIHQLPRQ